MQRINIRSLRIRFCASVCMLFFAVFSLCKAQSITWNGTVTDSESGDPVPYAMVELEGKAIGVTTNIEGAFTIKYPASNSSGKLSLKVTSLGYKSAIYPLKNTPEGTVIRISLIPDGVSIAAVTISDEKMPAKEYLEYAFSKVKVNNPREPFTMKGFYRHYCKDGGNYRRLIEASADIQDRRGYKKMFGHIPDRFTYTVNQLRRSYDYSNLYTGDHVAIALNSISMMDILALPSMLSDRKEKLKKLNPDYTYEYGPGTILDGRPVQVIEYSHIIPRRAAVDDSTAKSMGRAGGVSFIDLYDSLQGKVYIDAQSLAILSHELSYDRVTQYTFNNLILHAQHDTRVNYRKQGAFYYPFYTRYHLLSQQFKKDQAGNDSLTFDHDVNIQFMVNEIDDSKQTLKPYRELDYLALKDVPYTQDFWNGYNVIKATPLEDSITADLESKLDLNTQFLTFHERDDREQRDSAATQKFYNILKFDTLKPVFFTFWALKDTSLVFGKKHHKAMKKASHSGIRSILFNMDFEDDDFQIAKRVQKKNYHFVRLGKTNLYLPIYGDFVHGGFGKQSEIPRKYAVTDSPTMFYYNPQNGEIKVMEEPIGSRQLKKAIKRYRKAQPKYKGKIELP